jgi:hypothetical protein
MSEEKKIIRECSYSIKVTYYSDGSLHMKRVNKGFDMFELIGITELVQQELSSRINNENKPDIIERIVITNEIHKTNDPHP